jgi:hypothetical protein
MVCAVHDIKRTLGRDAAAPMQGRNTSMPAGAGPAWADGETNIPGRAAVEGGDVKREVEAASSPHPAPHPGLSGRPRPGPRLEPLRCAGLAGEAIAGHEP